MTVFRPGAKNTIKRLDKWRARLEEAASQPGDGEATEGVKKAAEASITQFEIAMNDDLNTPRACAALFTFLKKTEKGEISKGDAALALEVADKFDKVRPSLLFLHASFHSHIPLAFGFSTFSPEDCLCALTASPSLARLPFLLFHGVWADSCVLCLISTR